MSQTPMLSAKPGLYFHVDDPSGVVYAAVRDETTGTIAKVPVEDLGKLATTLMLCARDSAFRRKLRPQLPETYGGLSVPDAGLALYPHTDTTHLLVIAAGEALFAVELPNAKLADVGSAMLAASAATVRKN